MAAAATTPNSAQTAVFIPLSSLLVSACGSTFGFGGAVIHCLHVLLAFGRHPAPVDGYSRESCRSRSGVSRQHEVVGDPVFLQPAVDLVYEQKDVRADLQLRRFAAGSDIREKLAHLVPMDDELQRQSIRSEIVLLIEAKHPALIGVAADDRHFHFFEPSFESRRAAARGSRERGIGYVDNVDGILPTDVGGTR